MPLFGEPSLGCRIPGNIRQREERETKGQHLRKAFNGNSSKSRFFFACEAKGGSCSDESESEFFSSYYFKIVLYCLLRCPSFTESV